ncbi:hypothetical protein ACVWYT_008005 [Streptomyces sp. TE4109]
MVSSTTLAARETTSVPPTAATDALVPVTTTRVTPSYPKAPCPEGYVARRPRYPSPFTTVAVVVKATSSGTPSSAVFTLIVVSTVRPSAGSSSWTTALSARETKACRCQVPALSAQAWVTSPVRKSVILA